MWRRVFLMNSPRETADLARQIAPCLASGDVVLLEGPVGAGKTHFARSLVQALLPTPEDVPSPTFTLVQVYDTPSFEIWHADLYRLSDPDHVFELGLTEAFETALCLIEWPDRLGGDIPPNGLQVHLDMVPEDDNARRITLCSENADLVHRLGAIAA